MLYLTENLFAFDTYSISYITLLSFCIIQLISQQILKLNINPRKLFPKSKTWQEISPLLNQDKFTLDKILSSPNINETNPLENTSGSVNIYTGVYYNFQYHKSKEWCQHTEYLYAKELSEIRFHNLNDILNISIETSEFLRKCSQHREALEKIGIFIALEIKLSYDEYPDQKYSFNLDQNIRGD